MSKEAKSRYFNLSLSTKFLTYNYSYVISNKYNKAAFNSKFHFSHFKIGYIVDETNQPDNVQKSNNQQKPNKKPKKRKKKLMNKKRIKYSFVIVFNYHFY